MGIHVNLGIVPGRISNERWRAVYDEACHVARCWTPRPLSLGWRDIGSIRVAQYAFELDTTKCLHIIGDCASLCTTESFELPASLDADARGGRRPTTDSTEDLVIAVVQRNDEPVPDHLPWRTLFDAETQALPYHILMTALGLLVEHRLPRDAVVYGDISLRDAELARRGLARLLRGHVELPVMLDPPRLRARLGGAFDPELLDAVMESPADDALEAELFAELLGIERATPHSAILYELERVVCSCADPSLLSPGTLELLRLVVEKIDALVVAAELRERIAELGNHRTREKIADQLNAKMKLTSRAWDAVESSDTDDLAFMLAAASCCGRRLEVHLAVRGLLENPVLRSWAHADVE